MLLEYWNSQKSHSTIQQCFSCLLNEGITKICKNIFCFPHHQVDIKTSVKCWRDFFGYFNTLERHSGHAQMLKISYFWLLFMDFAFEVCLILAIAELTSLGTTSPRYNKQTAIYFPLDGSHLTIWLSASKVASVISATLIPSLRGVKWTIGQF